MLQRKKIKQSKRRLIFKKMYSDCRLIMVGTNDCMGIRSNLSVCQSGIIKFINLSNFYSWKKTFGQLVLFSDTSDSWGHLSVSVPCLMSINGAKIDTHTQAQNACTQEHSDTQCFCVFACVCMSVHLRVGKIGNKQLMIKIKANILRQTTILQDIQAYTFSKPPNKGH